MYQRIFQALVFFFLIVPAISIHAQDKQELRDCLEKLKTAKEDTNKVIWLNRVAWDTSYENLNAGLMYARQSLDLARKLNYAQGCSRALNTLGATYADMGNYPQALDAHLRNLRLCDSANIGALKAAAFMNLGNVYSKQGNPELSLLYFKKSRIEFEKRVDKTGLCTCLNNIGNAYVGLDSLDKARVAFRESIQYAHGSDSLRLLLYAYCGLAQASAGQKKDSEAEEEMAIARQILAELDNEYEYAQANLTFGDIRAEQHRTADAEKCYLKALQVSNELGLRDLEQSIYESFSKLYQETGQLEKSIFYYKRYMLVKDTLLNESVLRNQSELESVYKSEKKDQEIAMLREEESLQRIYLTGLVVGICVLTIIAFLIWNRSKIRKRTNEELEQRKAIIVAKNKDITDSISYARKIQTAMLPAPTELTRWFPDAFVLNRPRDIVSGDFWWLNEMNGEILFAVADCTGHGVPGGFMSVMGGAFLTEITCENGISEPDQVLGMLRSKVISSLNQQGDQARTQDGMDIVFCRYQPQTRLLEFACANNPLWLIRDGAVQEFTADKFPVGIYHGDLLPFRKQSVVLQPGDMIYLFSDGYADQFGGPAGKKFKYKQLRELIRSIVVKTVTEQAQVLETNFDTWRGQLEQVDDVLLLGIRIPS